MKIHRNGLVVKKILCDFKPYVLEGKRHKRYKLVAFLAHIGVDILLQIFLVELRLKALFDGVDIGLRAALDLVFEGYVKEKREVAYGVGGKELAKIDGHSCVDVLLLPSRLRISNIIPKMIANTYSVMVAPYSFAF